jgi:hypothetical protein
LWYLAGAPSLAEEWARARGKEVTKFWAKWHKQGNAAGPIRNQKMIDNGKPDYAVMFPGGRGTADMKRRLDIARIKVIEG